MIHEPNRLPTEPILKFASPTKTLKDFFSQGEKKDSLSNKNSGGKISGVMGLFPKSSPETMKNRRVL